jgi:hypothetical protein
MELTALKVKFSRKGAKPAKKEERRKKKEIINRN